MRRLAPLLLLASLAAPASAKADGFVLVNHSGANIVALSIRRTGSNDWRPLGASPSAGARMTVAFKDPDCAFDLRASFAGGETATWGGVNLCEVSTVTLNRDPATGGNWVDYD